LGARGRFRVRLAWAARFRFRAGRRVRLRRRLGLRRRFRLGLGQRPRRGVGFRPRPRLGLGRRLGIAALGLGRGARLGLRDRRGLVELQSAILEQQERQALLEPLLAGGRIGQVFAQPDLVLRRGLGHEHGLRQDQRHAGDQRRGGANWFRGHEVPSSGAASGHPGGPGRRSAFNAWRRSWFQGVR
jgi:hypothetical protein